MAKKVVEEQVEEVVTEAPVEEAAPTQSFNICHECNESGLVGPEGQEARCTKCGGKGKLGV